MSGEVYDAFVDAGASPDKARKAAEAGAGYDVRIGKSESDVTSNLMRIEQRFSAVDQRLSAIEQRVTKVEAKIDQLQWMIGLVLAANVALVLRTFFPG